uniref:Uncharacterized protein n=1 Tax=Strombidium rassoulzadegani TaxID=1082188 RepID=A0A7S3CSU1_9SPIT|mmetsp:Transcript_754/g.1354  ORF Transcript_754/g.1354 Transcript_754/m.1354 type:complete len:230 (+) Transcript_754:621-1310(+)
MPESGTFEFDFFSFDQRPDPEKVSLDSDIQQLTQWFDMTYTQLKQNMPSKRKEEAHAKIGKILGECFRGVAEYFLFNSEQLSQLVDLIDESNWKFEVYLAGVGRMVDYQNFDFIKHKMKFPEGMRKLYHSFGILNLFSPFRPNGAYLFKLDVHEEKLVCKMLLELSKTEGWANWQEVKMNGKTIEALSADFLASLPDSGTFEGTYICPPEKEKQESRVKIGVKYLDWQM